MEKTAMLELNGTKETTGALLEQRSERAERNRRLESIKMQRRRVRREKWLQGIKSLASPFAPGAETAN
jgi:hypothetical protein